MSEPLAEDEGLWVRSDVTPDGSYAVAITYGADRSFVLPPDMAIRYAATVAAAAHRAFYDAAIYTLLTKRVHTKVQYARDFIALDLRPERPPLDDAATAPLTFVPMMTPEGKAFVVIALDGKHDAQVDPEVLGQHALHVLTVVEAVNLDAALLRKLRSTIGLDEERARAVVGEIRHWGPEMKS